MFKGQAVSVAVRAAPGVPTWPYSAGATVIRSFLQSPLFALLAQTAQADVSGLEGLRSLQGPVLFAANHESHLDTPVLLAALPPLWRRRVAVAAARDYFFTRPLIGLAVGLMFTAFPVTRSEDVRPTLAHCLWLKEHGWSILIFPEGTRSSTGRIGVFKNGIGVFALKLQLPVVPVRTAGLFGILPKGKVLPRRGRVTVRFGGPFFIAPGMSSADATAAIAAAVRAL